MRYFFGAILVLFFTCDIFSQQKVAVDYCDYEIGDSVVTFVLENSHSKKEIVFINVHENEE
jgi:hypothetical protein